VKLIRHIPLVIVVLAVLAFPVAASANGDNHKRPHTTAAALVVADPTVAPTVAPGAGTSSLAAGTYTVGYAWRENGGTTLLSPLASVTIAAGQTIAVTLPAFPTGVSSADIYLSVAPNNTTLAFAANTTSDTTTLGALPLSNAAAPPTQNTTGSGTVDGDDDDDDEIEMDTGDDQSNSNDAHANSNDAHANSNDDHSSKHDSGVQRHDGESEHDSGGDD
jgi:hypothetical protein